MSVKHIKKYFDQISNDYLEMIDVIHELEKEVSEKIISQEKLDETLKNVEKLKENYMRWSYMMYLLNMPNKKEKQRVYEKRMKNVLSKIPEKDKINNVLNENRSQINTFQKTIKDI